MSVLNVEHFAFLSLHFSVFKHEFCCVINISLILSFRCSVNETLWVTDSNLLKHTRDGISLKSTRLKTKWDKQSAIKLQSWASTRYSKFWKKACGFTLCVDVPTRLDVSHNTHILSISEGSAMLKLYTSPHAIYWLMRNFCPLRGGSSRSDNDTNRLPSRRSHFRKITASSVIIYSLQTDEKFHYPPHLFYSV